MAPRIQEYVADTAPAGPLTTRQARNADTGFVGNAVSNLGSGLSDFGALLRKREAQSEITSLSATLAQAHADFSTGLDETLQTADPSDRTISDKFMQGYDEHMGSIADNISTPEAQTFFTKANADMRAHFQVQSMHGQAVLAGEHAVNGLQESLDSYSTSLLNDPSSFEQIRAQQALAIDAQVKSGLIPQNKADEFLTQGDTTLAKAAVRGWVSLDATYAKNLVDKGAFDAYLTGDAKYQLEREADMGIRAADVEKRRRQDELDRVKAQQQTATQNDFLTRMQDDKLTTKDILNSNLDPFGSGSKDTFIRMLDSASAGSDKIKSDPGVMRNLWDRIHLPDNDPQKIVDENALNTYFGRGLSLPDLQAFRGEIQGKKTQAGADEAMLKKHFLDQVEGQLVKSNPMLGLKDAQGEENYTAFLSNFLPAYEKAKQGGKTPTQLLNRDSPDYMGSMVAPYVRSPQDILKSQMGAFQRPSSAAVAPAAPNAAAPGSPPSTQTGAAKPVEPRRKGESPDDYLKRVKAAGG